ncbi:MAG: methionyl-tRNA formyltransferase [Gemmatales bacterium]|nr:MAG: methionyl-tRNA formyltransferase [Gemmatales bacterium]
MRLVMMGTGTFAEPTFEALIASRHEVAGLVTNPDRPSGKEREMLRGMKKIALAHDIPVFQPESINTPEGIAGLQVFQPELLVVAAYGQILSKEVLSVAPHGGINVHASLLPKYRGAAPINWAIYHGETRTGVTIIKMSVRMDAGDMLMQEAIDIGPEETAGELQVRLARLGAKLALETIDRIEKGTAHGVPQDQKLVTKAPKLKKEHGLIDWTRTAQQVCNQVRAMQPWPTAYSFLHRADSPPLRLIVHRAAATQLATDRQPGCVVIDPRHMNQLLVAAGDNSVVSLLDVQPAGKRRMSAAEFLCGHPIRSGDRFGGES